MKNFMKVLLLTICLVIVSVPVFGAEVLSAQNGFGLYNPTFQNTIIMSDRISVKLNDTYIDFMDSEGNIVEPKIINNRTMVPMRKIFEVLGAEVEWNGEDKSIIATKDDVQINLQIGNKNASLTTSDDETKEITLDAEPVIIENRTMVPVRFIAESLEKKVGWDGEKRTVIIIDTKAVEEKIKEAAPTWYEYLMTDLEEVKTAESNVKISGKLNYTDKDNKKNNSQLNFVGKGDSKIAENAFRFTLNLDVTGKGILVETIKEEDLEEIEVDLIIDMENGYCYITSTALEKADGKYIKYELTEEQKKSLPILLSQKNGMEDILCTIMEESELTLDSYENMMEYVNLLVEMFSDDHFKVSGRNTKTYECEMNLEDLLRILEAEYEVEIPEIKLLLAIKISDDVVQKKTSELDLKVQLEEESATMHLEWENSLKKYNQKVTIKMPKEKEIMTLED